jgi:NAD dependent epimerase/dehydratase family enzyme
MKKPFFFPNIPAVVLQIIFGKMAGILINGNKVSGEKIIAAGYSFQFPGVENALRDLLEKS